MDPSASIDEAGAIGRFQVDDALRASQPRAGAGDAVTFNAPREIGGPQVPDLLTSHPNAHAIPRHGGAVTDDQLMVRARTGLTPDGVKAKAPSVSSAFRSDDLLRGTDATIREGGALQAAIAQAAPGALRVQVTPTMVGDLGVDLGRGFERIGKQADLQGPLNQIDNLRSAQGVYGLDAASGRWQTITLFPTRP